MTRAPPLAAEPDGAQRAAGVLRIGSDLNYPPVAFRGADGRPDGLDPDLAEALGRVLGLRVEIVDTPFDDLMPGVDRGLLDVAMSGISDTPARRNALGEDVMSTGRPGVDFVDYFVARTSIIVQNGNPKGIRTLDELMPCCPPCCRPVRVRSARVVRSSVRTRATWFSTVRVERKRAAAMSLSVTPVARRSRICSSRGESPSP